MQEISRRRLLATTGAAFAGTALAGCSGGDSAYRIGESVTVEGLQLTLVGYDIRETLQPVPEEEPGSPSGEGTTDNATESTTRAPNATPTAVDPDVGNRFLILVIEMTVTGDSERSPPLPGGGFGSAQTGGEISLRYGGNRPPTVSSAGDLEVDGEVLSSVGEHAFATEFSMEPGESFTGVLVYQVAADAEVSTMELWWSPVEGPQHSWRIEEPEN